MSVRHYHRLDCKGQQMVAAEEEMENNSINPLNLEYILGILDSMYRTLDQLIVEIYLKLRDLILAISKNIPDKKQG